MELNYAVDYAQAVDEKFSAGRTSNDLWNSPSNKLYKFDGASHVKIPTLSVDTGRVDRKRNDLSMGAMADYSNDWEDKQLKFDREWTASVDPRDVDDDKKITTIANVTAEYNTSQKIPEQDCYMYSKLLKEKLAKDAGGVHYQELTEDNILQAFDDMMQRMDESSVSGKRLLYLTPKIAKMLKYADLKNRNGVINGAGSINRTVSSLDDVTIVKVPSSRMKTDFDFSVGAKQKAGAQQIQMFLIVNGVQIAPDKYDFVGLEAPRGLTKGNYLYYESQFSDVFLLDNKVAGYEAYVMPKADDPVAPKQEEKQDKAA